MILKPIDIQNTEYLHLCEQVGCVFNLPAWLNLYGKRLQLIGIFNANYELIGCFHFSLGSKFGFKFALLPSFTPSNGFLLQNPASNAANIISFEKDVHQEICNYLKQQKFKLFMSAFPTHIKDMQAYFWNNYKVIPNYTYQLDLNLSEEELFNRFSSERRKSIKKAIKDAIEIKQATKYDAVLDLINATFSRKQKHINQNLVKKILFEFATSENSFAYVAYQHEKPIACTFIIYYKNVAYYLLGGYHEALKHHGAGPSCMWKSILHAKELGTKTFDFEGSMLPEVENYFRDFGGELVPYYTVQKAWLPFEILLKFKMRNKF